MISVTSPAKTGAINKKPVKKRFHLIFGLATLLALLIIPAAHAAPDSVQDASSPYDAPLPDFSTPVTLEEVRLAYYRYSAVSIVKKLHENHAANWKMIMSRVEKGDPDWIAYSARYISPGTDAGATTGYTVALALALPNNPKAVLELETGGGGRSLLAVCTLPFIEPEYDFIRAYGKKTLDALREVKDDYLLESRDTCIRRLQNSLEMAEKRKAEGKWQW